MTAAPPAAPRAWGALLRRARWAPLALLAAACATTPARPRQGDLAGLERYVHARAVEERDHSGADAVAIVLVDKGGIVWSDMLGGATLDSRFRVGSISKLMTSLTALSLRDEGKLDLDAPITDVLPWFSVGHRFDTPAITARALMTHHSGLPSNILKGMYGTHAVFEDHVHALAHEDMVRPVGEMFSYSDVGYTVLGAVVEAAGGAPFAQLAETRTLRPIGMTHSTFVPTRDVFRAVVDGEPFVENAPITAPANGLVTTPRDVAAEARFLLAGSDPRVKEALTPHDTAPLDLDWRTGFGFNENDAFAGVPVYWHSGQTLAFTAELVVCPRKNIAVVVMTNTREAGLLPSIVAWDAMGAALGARAAPMARSSTAFTPEELEAYAGTYPTEYGTITLARDGDTLRGRAFDQPFELLPTARRTFVPWVLVGGVVPFQPDLLRGVELAFDVVDGKRALISLQRGQRILRGLRVEPAPLPAAWLARVGHWDNPDRGDDQITVTGADLFVDDAGFLVARVAITHAAAPFSVPLVPLDDDTAITAGVGRYLGETVRVVDGKLHLVGYDLVRTP